MLAQSQDRNAFLSALSFTEFALVRPHLTRFELRVGDSLHYTGQKIEDVVFPHSGLVAMTIPLDDSSGAGVALIGREGNRWRLGFGRYRALLLRHASLHRRTGLTDAGVGIPLRFGSEPRHQTLCRAVRQRAAYSGATDGFVPRDPFRRGTRLPLAA